MAGIQLSGLGSGIDTAAIVSQLMSIERLPRQKLAYQQAAAEARRTSLSDIQTKLSSLKLAASDLGSTLTWLDTQAVTSSNEAKVSAIRSGGSGPGTYSVNVTQMASAERRTYDFASPPVDTDVTIGSGSTSTVLTVAAGTTLDDLVARINSTPETGVFAVNVSGQMVLSSRQTGVASAISVQVDNAEVPAAAVVAGKDANYTIDGGPVQTSATNTIKNAIPGLDLTLKGLTTAEPVDITVGAPAPDTKLLKDRIKAFVSAYNDALTLARTKYEEKGVLDPQNNVDAGKGVLRSDIGLGRIISDMRSAVSSVVAGADGDLNLLSQIGISTGAATSGGVLDPDAIAGKLKFDEAAFDAAYANDPTKVRKLLGAGSDGFSQSFSALIDQQSSASGLLSLRVLQADDQISAVKSSLDRFDRRLELRQQYLERQFQAMESAMSRSQAVSQQLAAQLVALLPS